MPRTPSAHRRSWVILTPEYPPAAGGVAGYVAQLASGLERAGDPVEVWSPAPADEPLTADGALIHELPNGFDRAARRAITESLRSKNNPVVLVQYVPLALGGLDVIAWLLRLQVPLWVMFHEVGYPLSLHQSLKHRALGAGTHYLARLLLKRADRVLISIPAWELFLRWLGRPKLPPVWLPIPGNVPTAPTRPRDEVLRHYGLDPTRPVIGHFSVYSGAIRAGLRQTLELVLRDPNVQLLLIGRNSEGFREELLQHATTAATRCVATGELPPAEVACALGAPDLLVFPHNEGVSTRRTTVMSALSLGKAVVTTTGWATEALWAHERCLELCPFEPSAIAARVLELANDPERRQQLGTRARAVYTRRFSMERVVERLRSM